MRTLRSREFDHGAGKFLNVADAIGLAVFTVLGCRTALAHGAGIMITVIMGMLTGSGGGIIRDVFSAEIPLFFRKEIYATACLIGGSAYLVLLALPLQEDWADDRRGGSHANDQIGCHSLGLVSAVTDAC